MEQKKIKTETNKNIGIITLNRPEKLNVFDEEMFLEYEKALKTMDENKDVKVLVIRGEGKAFCTGIELDILKGMDRERCVLCMKKLQKITSLMRNISKPVITMVHDLALAFGIGLVAASDITIAAIKARFGATAINIGLFCMGPAVFLIQSVGLKRTFELLFSGRIIYADEALKIGLINKVVPIEDLEKETFYLAREIGSKEFNALYLGKRFLYKMFEEQTEKNSKLATHYFSLLFSKWRKNN